MPSLLTKYFYFIVVNCVQFAIEFVYNVPIFSLFFIESIDPLTYFGPLPTALKMTIGPVIGFILQPLIGAISDHSTFKMGRRRPYIIIGTTIWIIGSVVIVGSACFPVYKIENYSSSYGGTRIYFDCLFVIGDIIWSIGINIIQVAHRAFILDEFDSFDQYKVTLVGSIMTGLGQCTYFILSTLLVIIVDSTSNDDNPSGLVHLRFIFIFVLFLLSMFILPCCVGIFCWFTNETAFMSIGDTIHDHISNLWISIKEMNKNMYIILLVVFCGWLAWSPIKDNLHPYYENYLFYDKHDSILYYNLNRLLFACILVITGVVLFFFDKWVCRTIQLFHLFAGISAVVYYIPTSNDNFILSYVISFVPLIFIAMAYCQLNSLPYALTRSVVKTDDFGFFVGLVNNSLTLSQLVINGIYFIVYMSVSSLTISLKYFMYLVCPTYLFAAVISLLLWKVIKSPKLNERAVFQDIYDIYDSTEFATSPGENDPLQHN
ncbi:Sucrose transporter [Entamoeba marina]